MTKFISLVVAMLVALVCTSAAMADPPDVYAPGQFKKGDTIQRGQGAVSWPGVGNGVVLTSTNVDGSDYVLTVKVWTDGTTVVQEQTDPPDGSPCDPDFIGDCKPIFKPVACDDNAWNPTVLSDGNKLKWMPTDLPIAWKIKTGSIPTGDNVSTTVSKIRDGISIWPGDTGCGHTDALSSDELGTSYGGSTSTSPDMAIQNGVDKCDTPDNNNIIGFGDLARTSSLAITCTYPEAPLVGNFWTIKSADVKFNTHDWNFSPSDPGSCTGDKPLYRAVASHEFGHFFGLAHVNETDHGNLTMSTRLNAFCKEPEYTLGLGDLLAIENFYNTHP